MNDERNRVPYTESDQLGLQVTYSGMTVDVPKKGLKAWSKIQLQEMLDAQQIIMSTK